MIVCMISKFRSKFTGWSILLLLGFFSVHINLNRPVTNDAKKYIAIVIDDFGGYAAGIKAMMGLKYPLTFAVLPFENFSAIQAREAKRSGFEVIVHLPFESYDAKPEWYGQSYISASASKQEIINIMQNAFKTLPMASGLSNHMGSKATSSPKIVKTVLQELVGSNRFYFDSKTSLHSPAPELARELAVPFINRDIFLDTIPTRQNVLKQLNRLMECANKKGRAVAIGHVGPFGPALATILREELPNIERKGFTLVKLSQLIPGPQRLPTNDMTRIGIDPGHGGIDSGTKIGNQTEKDLNLEFSKKLAEKLKKNGYEVVFSRTADTMLTPYCQYVFKNRPYKRDDLERRLQKLQNFNADIIISIHANWSNLPFQKGAVVFYTEIFPQSGLLAKNIQDDLNATTGIRKAAHLGNYYLLNHAKIPAIIIELGYISNHEERDLLHTNWYQERLIDAIILGLKKTCPP